VRFVHRADRHPGKSSIVRDYIARFMRSHPGALLYVVDLKVSQSGQYTAAMAGRARWALHSNGGVPAADWPAGERLIVAFLLGLDACIEAEGETREGVLGRIAGNLSFYGDITTDPAEWADKVRAVLDLPRDEYTAATRAWNLLT
jgi:hypothetical protein